MNATWFWSCCLMALALAAGAAAQEEPPGLDVAFETTAVSSYLWRGFVVNDSPSLQPAVTVDYKGLSFNGWYNFSSRVPNGQAWTEHDMTVEYSRDIRGLTASVGYTHYLYPDLTAEEGRGSNEFYVGISKESWLNPSLRSTRTVPWAEAIITPPLWGTPSNCPNARV